jgi:gamma-glutamylcyclotransferase (GGCT)/AIG2-like uncharacterized protein YtfP
MSKHLVFVYGSLRSGGAGAMPIRFPNSKFIAEAKVSGDLYDLGDYPGLQLKESGSLVVGEVYEVDDEILNELDTFEGSSDYLREQWPCPKSRLDELGTEPVAVATGCFQRDYPLATASGSVPDKCPTHILSYGARPAAG